MSGDHCFVPGCRRRRHASGLCHGHYERLERDGDVRADEPLGTPARGTYANPTRAMVGPFICLCQTSKPDVNGACIECGYPCVYRMAPRVRDAALSRRPSLRHQEVAG